MEKLRGDLEKVLPREDLKPRDVPKAAHPEHLKRGLVKSRAGHESCPVEAWVRDWCGAPGAPRQKRFHLLK